MEEKEKQPVDIQEQISGLHNVSQKIYGIIDELISIGADTGLAGANLRDASKEIQTGIGRLINKQLGLSDDKKNIVGQ